MICLLELYYLRSAASSSADAPNVATASLTRSHFSISLTGGWQVVRCEIRFGDRYDSFKV
ncbi:MAG TPA: hypothetical protein V6D11_13525 [Waterburya sp.]